MKITRKVIDPKAFLSKSLTCTRTMTVYVTLAACVALGSASPALFAQSASLDEGKDQIAQQAPGTASAANNKAALGTAGAESTSLSEESTVSDPSSASSVDADGVALQAAIRQAIDDLQAKRKAQQQASALNRSTLASRNAPEWQQLALNERNWLQPLSTVWHELPSADRYAWIQLARQLPKMSAMAQEQALDRMKQWSTFTPQQRQTARENFRLAQKLNDSRLSEGQLQALWERYRELTPEQRAVLRAAGQTASTAARHAGAATPLAKEAARPLPALDRHGKPSP